MQRTKIGLMMNYIELIMKLLKGALKVTFELITNFLSDSEDAGLAEKENVTSNKEPPYKLYKFNIRNQCYEMQHENPLAIDIDETTSY